MAKHVNRRLPIKSVLYGAPGSGKTTLSGSAALHPAMCPVFFLSIEGGMLSVPQNENIHYFEARNKLSQSNSSGGKTAMDVAEDAFWALANKSKIWNDIPTAEIKTVVIDSGTELQTLSLEGNVQERKGDLDTLWLQDYGKSTASMKRLLRYFRDLEINVIVTALAQDVFEGKGESAIRSAVEPMFTMKLRESVKGVFDHVWYNYKSQDESGGDVYSILTRQRGLYFAKTRGQNFSKALGDKVVNPSMPYLYDLLQSSEGGIA